LELAKIILEFIKVLIWPGVTIFVLIKFKPQIEKLFERLKKADFPGGLSLETLPENIEKV